MSKSHAYGHHTTVGQGSVVALMVFESWPQDSFKNT